MLKNASPKVNAQAITTIFVGVLVSALLAVTPDMLKGLGFWAPVAGVAITSLAGYLSGYFITDPIRQTGEAVHAAAASAVAAAAIPAPDTSAKSAAFDQAVTPPALDESAVEPALAESTTDAPVAPVAIV